MGLLHLDAIVWFAPTQPIDLPMCPDHRVTTEPLLTTTAALLIDLDEVELQIPYHELELFVLTAD